MKLPQVYVKLRSALSITPKSNNVLWVKNFCQSRSVGLWFGCPGAAWGNIFGPQPKMANSGEFVCLGLAQLVCLSLSLAEPGKIMNIIFVYSLS